MFIEDFQKKYTTIPFATFSRDHKKNTDAPNFASFSHMHKELELLLVLDGKAQLHVDSLCYTIQKGDIVIIAPYTLHRYTLLDNCDFKHYCLCFDLDLLYDKQMKANIESGSTTITNIIKNNPLCTEYIKNSFLAHAEKRMGWEFSVVGNISLFFGALKKDGHIKDNVLPYSQSIYFKIFDYVSQNFSDDITSSDLANHLGMSHSFFCRLFKKSFGDCFANYLCIYRIEKSKPLLRYTDAPISDIALNVGFNSFSYYSKKFKEYNLLTPSEYRANKKEANT